MNRLFFAALSLACLSSGGHGEELITPSLNEEGISSFDPSPEEQGEEAQHHQEDALEPGKIGGGVALLCCLAILVLRRKVGAPSGAQEAREDQTKTLEKELAAAKQDLESKQGEQQRLEQQVRREGPPASENAPGLDALKQTLKNKKARLAQATQNQEATEEELGKMIHETDTINQELEELKGVFEARQSSNHERIEPSEQERAVSQERQRLASLSVQEIQQELRALTTARDKALADIVELIGTVPLNSKFKNLKEIGDFYLDIRINNIYDFFELIEAKVEEVFEEELQKARQGNFLGESVQGALLKEARRKERRKERNLLRKEKETSDVTEERKIEIEQKLLMLDQREVAEAEEEAAAAAAAAADYEALFEIVKNKSEQGSEGALFFGLSEQKQLSLYRSKELITRQQACLACSRLLYCSYAYAHQEFQDFFGQVNQAIQACVGREVSSEPFFISACQAMVGLDIDKIPKPKIQQIWEDVQKGLIKGVGEAIREDEVDKVVAKALYLCRNCIWSKNPSLGLYWTGQGPLAAVAQEEGFPTYCPPSEVASGQNNGGSLEEIKRCIAEDFSIHQEKIPATGFLFNADEAPINDGKYMTLPMIYQRKPEEGGVALTAGPVLLPLL